MAKIYSFKNKAVLFEGIQIQGFAKGDGLIKYTFTKDRLTPDVGGDGFGVMNLSPDKSGTLELKLQSTSPSNAILSAANITLDTPLPQVIAVLVKDSRDQTYLQGGFMVDNPPYEDGSNSPDLVWKLKTLNCNLFRGGLTPDTAPTTAAGS